MKQNRLDGTLVLEALAHMSSQRVASYTPSVLWLTEMSVCKREASAHLLMETSETAET